MKCVNCKKDKYESEFMKGIRKCKDCIKTDVKEVNRLYPAPESGK